MNAGASAASTAAMAAVVASNNAREEAEAEERRNRNKGHDQIYFESDYSGDRTGREIAKVFKWKWENNTLWKPKPRFNWSAFFISLFVMAFVLAFIGIFLEMSSDRYCYDIFCGFSHAWIMLFAIPLALFMALLLGGDSSIDYITINEYEKKTYVLIKVYDSDGYRNVDDDKIHLIRNRIERRLKE